MTKGRGYKPSRKKLVGFDPYDGIGRNLTDKHPYGTAGNMVQDQMAELLDEKTMFEEFRREILPKLREAAKFSDVGSMLEAYAPYAVIGLMDLAQSAKKEEVKLNARIRLLEHATGKPIQRNLVATKNLDELPEKELEALLRSELKRLKETNPSLHSQFIPLVKDKDTKNDT